MKNLRQNKILELISVYSITGQETLIDYLKKEGFTTTQATISRDIKELNLVKAVDNNGVYRYVTSSHNNAPVHSMDRISTIFKEAVLTIDYAGNTVAIKCYTGMANAACEVFDSMRWDNVVATLSGDGTFFVLMRTETDAKELCEKLKKQFVK